MTKLLFIFVSIIYLESEKNGNTILKLVCYEKCNCISEF